MFLAFDHCHAGTLLCSNLTFSTHKHSLLQIEPTESEGLVEIDRFCDAMITIKQEADEIAAGRQPRDNNVIKNAPHTVTVIASDEWDRPYSRQQAVYPDKRLRRNKFWPASGRVDEVYGERNVSKLDLAVLQATFLTPCMSSLYANVARSTSIPIYRYRSVGPSEGSHPFLRTSACDCSSPLSKTTPPFANISTLAV